MNIHNSMEDAVNQEVNSLYDTLKNEHIAWLTCDCENCRLDTICYVLNRTQPKYFVSERGVLHNTLDMDDSQLKTDLTALAMEGIRLINGSHRSKGNGTSVQTADETSASGKFFYNFPLIVGSIYNGENFEPLEDAVIKLKINDELVKMADSTWSNPATTYKSTKGSYTFWPASIECNENDGTKVFSLTFEITGRNFVSSTYAIELPLVPEAKRKTTLESTYSLKIKDIFLFDQNALNPME